MAFLVGHNNNNNDKFYAKRSPDGRRRDRLADNILTPVERRLLRAPVPAVLRLRRPRRHVSAERSGLAGLGRRGVAGAERRRVRV